MRRSAALAPLSREHHQALEVALLLRRATPATVAAARQRFARFWAQQGAGHFAAEESLLLDALPAGDAGWTPLADRLVAEHATLRRLADDLLGPGDGDRSDLARRLGRALHDHVRFEEREVFCHLEEALAPAALEALGRRVARACAAADVPQRAAR